MLQKNLAAQFLKLFHRERKKINKITHLMLVARKFITSNSHKDFPAAYIK